jgi:hypothetical protein
MNSQLTLKCENTEDKNEDENEDEDDGCRRSHALGTKSQMPTATVRVLPP